MELPSGIKVSVPKAIPIFEKWSGEPVKDTYNNKPVLNFEGKTAFAEIIILRIFQDDKYAKCQKASCLNFICRLRTRF